MINSSDELKDIKESLTEIMKTISNNEFNINLIDRTEGEFIVISYNSENYEIPFITDSCNTKFFGNFLSDLSMLYKALPLILSLNINVIEKLEAIQLKGGEN